jgi:hypothetical protein
MGQESRTTRAKHRRRTRRLRRQRGGGNQDIVNWIVKLKETFPGIYGSKTQDESYELLSLKNDNLTIAESSNGDMGLLDPKAFAESTQFYNVSKDVNIILQNVLIPGFKPKDFLEYIISIQRPSQSNDPETVMMTQALTFLEEVEKAMRFAAKSVELANTLTNQEAYPLFIWAIAMNVTVTDNDQGVPILFAPKEPGQSEQPMYGPQQQPMYGPQQQPMTGPQEQPLI